MSPFERFVRKRLGNRDPSWAHEWDACLEEVRSPLAELRRRGGDAQFALFVLSNYRWRQVVSLGPIKERDALIKQIDRLLGNKGPWFQYAQQSGGEPWKAAEGELRRAKSRLLSIRPRDRSAFEETHSEQMAGGPRWDSDRSYTCLWILDWYFRQVRGVSRVKRRLLAELLLSFGFLGRSDEPILLVAQRLRRNPRVRKGSRAIRNINLAHFIRMYHVAHSEAGVECGPLCKAQQDVLFFSPPIKVERLTERARALERKKKHAEAARCYGAALRAGERFLGTDHPYLAWILVRYWMALRAAGREAEASKVRPRAEAMWAKYGTGHLSG